MLHDLRNIDHKIRIIKYVDLVLDNNHHWYQPDNCIRTRLQELYTNLHSSTDLTGKHHLVSPKGSRKSWKWNLVRLKQEFLLDIVIETPSSNFDYLTQPGFLLLLVQTLVPIELKTSDLKCSELNEEVFSSSAIQNYKMKSYFHHCNF